MSSFLQTDGNKFAKIVVELVLQSKFLVNNHKGLHTIISTKVNGRNKYLKNTLLS